jgi:hypothetical protein
MGVVTLLRRPALAVTLGRRGHRRLGRIYNDDACVSGYRELLRSAAVGLYPTPSSANAPRIAA